MSAPIRRLLVALALACSGLVLTQLPAHACTCGPDDSLRTHARDADVVFSGVLVQQDRGRKRSTFTLDVERIYQGRVADTPVDVVSETGTTCGLAQLKLDRAYLVFATEAKSRLESAKCTGTGRATPAYVADVERVLGQGNAIPKPPPPDQEPPAPEYNRVDDADPPAFTRLAAPGGAMVLIGLLGLALFRKRS